MRISKPVLTGIAAALCAGTAAASPPQTPTAVAAALKDVASLCTEVGGKAVIDHAVKRADLNSDGNEDYVLDFGSVICDGAAGVYGDREKGVTVYVGDGKGAAKQAFSDMVYGMNIEGTGPAAKLWLTVSAEACGKKAAANFASETFCDRAVVWNSKTQAFDYAPVSTVRMIQ
jgi:hypothetical protein